MRFLLDEMWLLLGSVSMSAGMALTAIAVAGVVA